jgi:hypothetical protein
MYAEISFHYDCLQGSVYGKSHMIPTSVSLRIIGDGVTLRSDTRAITSPTLYSGDILSLLTDFLVAGFLIDEQQFNLVRECFLCLHREALKDCQAIAESQEEVIEFGSRLGSYTLQGCVTFID